MNTERRDFDKEAASWDEQPARIRLAKDIADAISGQVPPTTGMSVLDFGCGTGLLTTRLQPLVGFITGMDSSQGMLDVFNKKIEALSLPNVNTMLVDLDKGDSLSGTYDLVVSGMTLHHVKNIEALLEQFNKVLITSGHLCIADLDLEEGRFHHDNTGVFHFGFDRDTLKELFRKSGFTDVRDITASEFVKPGADGEMVNFSVFLIIGRKI